MARHRQIAEQPGLGLPLDSLHFLLGFNRGAYVAHTRVVAIKHSPDLLAYLNRTGGSPDDDWLILVLDQPLGEKYGMLKLAAQPLRRNDKVRSAGYAQDKSQIMTADLDCQLRGWLVVPKHRSLLVHDCETTHGNCGGPLLALQDGEWRIAGVSVAIHWTAKDKSKWVGVGFDVAVVRTLIDKLNAAPAKPSN